MTILVGDPSGVLRQGDVCVVDFFPRWDVAKSQTVSSQSGTVAIQMSAWNSVKEGPDGGHLVVVCSHDCDVDNPRQRTGLLLAPVIKTPAHRGTELYATIMGSDQILDGVVHAAGLFPLSIPDVGGEATDVVIDFSSLISMGQPVRVIPMLREKKLYEMDDAMRVRFKMKLAAFVGRP